MNKIGFVGAKNGVGTTTTAAMFAMICAQRGINTALVTDTDGFAVLGLPTAAINDGVANLTVYNTEIMKIDPIAYEDCSVVIFDGEYSDTTVVVTRPCYLALRRAVANDTAQDPRVAGIVFLAEPHRALSSIDCARALGKPILAEIPVDPVIARASDAGLMASRLPKVAFDALQDMVPSEVLS